MILLVVLSCRSLPSPDSSTSSILSVFHPCKSVSPFSNLPVFDERVWNFFQETRRPLQHFAVTGVQTHVRIGQIKFVSCARDSDVQEAPLLFESVTRVERAGARKHSVAEPDYEHGVKLESLRLMNRRQIDRLFFAGLVRGRFRIDVANECQLRKEFVDVFELACKNGELIQIFTTQLVVREIRLCVIVIDCFDDRCDHLRRRIRLPARRNLIEGVRELAPRLFRSRANIHSQDALAKLVAGIADPGGCWYIFGTAISDRGYSTERFVPGIP